jgi:PTS system D-glucosamine-specific IIC component
MEVAGTLVEGAQNIFFAQLAHPATSVFSVEATRFMSGKFPLMIFGLPGAALAMYHCSKDNKKKIAGGLLLSAALTSMLTGITEPIEFTFLFVAPILYIIHSIFAGAAYMLMHIFKVGVGMTFSGGFIDLSLFGILQGNAKTNWIWVVIIGLIYFAVYYVVFRYLITKFNYKTPGREEDDEETKLYTRADVNAKDSLNKTTGNDSLSANIVKGLGGAQNISDVDCCATRLRITVFDVKKVSQDVLKATNASGVVIKGNGVQIIYGPRVSVIKSNLEDYLLNPNEHQEEDYIVEAKTTDAKEVFVSPLCGRLDLITATPDVSFSQKMMGDGVVIFPSSDTLVAPCDGEVLMIFPTKHAIGMVSENGIEFLIHVGIDTVALNGVGFETLVEVGQKVTQGTPLLKFDLDYVRAHAKSDATVIVFTNLNNQKISLSKLGDINKEEEMLKIA